MNEIIVNDWFIHTFVLAFACTALIVFINNYIRYLIQKQQIKQLFTEMKHQHILINHLKKTVIYFSKPENVVNQCPVGTECNTAKSIHKMAKETLEKIE